MRRGSNIICTIPFSLKWAKCFPYSPELAVLRTEPSVRVESGRRLHPWAAENGCGVWSGWSGWSGWTRRCLAVLGFAAIIRRAAPVFWRSTHLCDAAALSVHPSSAATTDLQSGWFVIRILRHRECPFPSHIVLATLRLVPSGCRIGPVFDIDLDKSTGCQVRLFW